MGGTKSTPFQVKTNFNYNSFVTDPTFSIVVDTIVPAQPINIQDNSYFTETITIVTYPTTVTPFTSACQQPLMWNGNDNTRAGLGLFQTSNILPQEGWLVTMDVPLDACFNALQPIASYDVKCVTTSQIMQVSGNDVDRYVTFNAVTLGATDDSNILLSYEVEVTPILGNGVAASPMLIEVTWKTVATSFYRLPTFNLARNRGRTLEVGEYLFGTVSEVSALYTQNNGDASCKQLVVGTPNYVTTAGEECCTEMGGSNILDSQCFLFSNSDVNNQQAIQFMQQARQPGVTQFCMGLVIVDPPTQCWRVRVPEPIYIERIPTQYVIKSTGSATWTSTVSVNVLGRLGVNLSADSLDNRLTASVSNGLLTVTGTSDGGSYHTVRVSAEEDDAHAGQLIFIRVLA